MADDIGELQRKWDARYRDSDAAGSEPCYVLTAFQHLLPGQGRALDVACGLGGNALFLAQRGLSTEGWDISSVAIGKLAAEAQRRRLPVAAHVRDACAQPPSAAAYDVIVVSRFLERSLAPHLVEALRPGGLLFYQTFTAARVDDTGPAAGPYRLADNELRELFAALRLRAYREEALVGDVTAGWRNEALLVGQKLP